MIVLARRLHGWRVDLLDFERRIGQVQGPGDLWPLCTLFLHEAGIHRATYVHLPPIGAPDADVLRQATQGYESDQVQRYLDGGFKDVETRLAYARQQAAPFYWDEVPELPPATVKEHQLRGFRASLRQNNGLGVPVFGPNGRNGYCGLELGPGISRLSPDRVWMLRDGCQAAHIRFCAMILPTLGPLPNLSGRETQVLSWVARGKSNAAIGEILGISAHTVDAHLRRVFLKLGVYDRITAAVRGIGVGLIHS
jgi:LuxR family transcriptional regulator, quorum-sensing system regulator CciR